MSDSTSHPSRILASVLLETKGDAELLTAREVCDALSAFFAWARRFDARLDEVKRFEQDDGVVIVRATADRLDFQLAGYVWWIDQSVDPLWARLNLDPDGEIRGYDLGCGVQGPEDRELRYPNLRPPEGRHVNRVLEAPSIVDIEKAWISEQLQPDSFPWLFSYTFDASDADGSQPERGAT